MRSVVAGLILIAAAAALYAIVIVPYRCNLVEGRVSRSLASIWDQRESYGVRPIAERNLAQLASCLVSCKSDVNLHMLAGANLDILGRHSAAIEAYKTGLAYDERPELYIALGNAMIRAGEPKEQAVEHFVKAGEFLGAELLADIPDPEARWQAISIVGARREKALREHGMFDDHNRIANASFASPGPLGRTTATTSADVSPSAAAAWDMYNAKTQPISTALVPSTRRAGNALHVTVASAHSGVLHSWKLREATPRVRTSAWVYVKRGRVYLGSGDGRPPMMDVFSQSTGRWELLTAVNASCPALVTVICAAGDEGAEFYVDEISAVETLAAPPCEL
jgi:tetratricopeptide (TPR) repeat protein